MTYSQILDVINQNIKKNENKEITGVVLNSVLRALLGFVNDGFITINDVIQILADTKSVNIVGSIGLTTDTTSLPAGVYNTQTSGTYINASNIVVKEGYYTLLRKKDDGTWVLESETKMPMQDLTPLENLNGGDVEFGNIKNVEGGKVFNYVNNKSITKFNPNAYEGGYPKDALVFHNDNVWRSMVNLNTETPQKGTSKWNEVKFNSNSKITIKDLSKPLPKDYDGDMIPVWNESLKDWSTAFQVRESPLASTIPVRSGDGNLKTDKALQDEDAVSKVNENIVIFNTISEARDYLNKTKYVDFGKVVFVKSEDTYYKVNRDKNDLVTLINESGQLISFFDLNDTPDSGFNESGKVLKVGENGKIVFENITKDDFDSNTEEGLNVFLWNTETKAWESTLVTKNNTSYSIAMRGENGTLQVGKAVNDREAVNLGQLKDYANPNALIKPEEEGNLDDFPYVVGVNGEGDTAFLPVNSFGKVDTVMGVEPDANKNVDISGIETNWTNESHRWSNLPNKSADATYDKVMVLDDGGKAGVKDIDFVPYTGAKKSIDLNTQNLRIGGDFNKSYSTLEKSHLDPNEIGITKFTRLTDVASFSRGNDKIQTDCIVITLPINTTTRWVMEVDILGMDVRELFGGSSTKLLISAYHVNNMYIGVSAISNADNVKSVSFCRDSNNNTIIIIRPNDNAKTIFNYGKVNIANFYHYINYNTDLAVKSNYKVEAVLESSLTGLTTNGTITNAEFNRDSYYLDFRNFTNIPNFAQASNVFAKNEPTNWTNPSQQFSGLVDKSTDATYNKVMVLDAEGKAGTKDVGDLGKVKTVNGQEPNENGDIEIEDSEFVKNGEGWSLKYRVDNPSFYGTIGKDAIDLSVATTASTVEGYEYGANGLNSIVFGVNNSAMGNDSFVAGSSNKSQGSDNHIIGSNSTIIENKGTATVWSCVTNGIYSGDSHKITNANSSVIIGGLSNKITGDENPGYDSSYSDNNIIIGGYNNKIFLNPDADSSVKSSSILGGELNKAQGCYNIVGGQYNHAVTVGETLFGLCGTIQNTSLKGYDTLDTKNPIENTRIFNIGIGREIDQHNIIRKDGLSVFRHGLVTAPSLTKELINSNPKSVVTKEYINPDTLINILESATTEQIITIREFLNPQI